ncbi:hypothetical protein WICPIJ_009318 [Wickerhamomyces pijperi]|uniref:Thioredoxin domain-containing protein n=1 Tax=Wickerhamomyces pijperi TaxID=599730 RepID=A0A9P8PP44_WICPI|nr:hypothetical protein WICPIJ_009318 [Wickerhamomyces pijperi]
MRFPISIPLSLLLIQAGLSTQQQELKEVEEDLPEPQSLTEQKIKVSLPEALTAVNFKSQLHSKKISLVEFYSPYCSHCKHFAPTWESTYEHNHEYFTDANIGFFQVNCVESGDLCSEQEIAAYPSFRLYSDEAVVLKEYKGERKEQSLVKFLRKNENQEVGTYTDLTKFLTVNEFLVKAEAVSDVPEVYVFLPASSTFETIDDLVKKTHYDVDMVNQIKLISDKLDTYIINRRENQAIYDKFKPNEDDGRLTFYLKVPGRSVLSMFKYRLNENDEQFLESFTTWCIQMISIAQFPDISNLAIFGPTSTMNPMNYLPAELNYDPSLHYENTYIFFYDPETTFEEDLQILEHLLVTFSELQNVRFYKSSDDFKYFLELQKNVIQANFRDIPDEHFNEYQFIVDSITSLPTLVMINPMSPVLTMYQNFGSTEIRDFYRVSDWIKETNKPLIYDFYRQNHELWDDPNSLVVLQVVDEYNELLPALKIAKDYQYLLKNYQYDRLEVERKIKKDDLESFKKSPFYNINDYVRKTIREIYPLNQNFKKVKFAYLFENETSILTDFGLNINSRVYKTNDVIIVDRSTQFYYESTPALATFSLVNSPSDITNTLLALNEAKDFPVLPLLRSSPYGGSLRFMDNLHKFGVRGYFFVIVVVVCAVMLNRFRKRTRSSHSGPKYGILDDPTKFD